MTDAEEDPAATAQELLAGTSASERAAILEALLREQGVDPVTFDAVLSGDATPPAEKVEEEAATANRHPAAWIALGDRLEAIATASSPDAVADELAPALEMLLATEAAILYRHDPSEAAFVPAARTEAAPADPDAVTPEEDRRWVAVRGEDPAVVRAENTPSLVVPVPGTGALQVLAVDPGVLSPVRLATIDRLASVAVPVAALQRRHQHRGEQVEALRTENEQLRDFANIVSHDLRNPLSVARGYLDLAVQEGEDEYVEKVREAHDRIESIVEHTLALAEEGSQAGGRTPVELDDIARQAWGVVEAPDGELEIADSRVFEADRERLQQLLENLFRNAVEHGVPDEAADADRALTVRVGTTPAGFFVEDDGPGIPPAEREKVFERGYTASGDGTGIGLDVVSDVAEAHGWSIDVVESAAGGARFEIDT